ncbi:MAG: S8 family serine peptidase, partial [Anaerolineae bacterium]
MNWRRVFNLLFAALFVLSLLPAAAMAQEGATGTQPAATIEQDLLDALAEGPTGFWVEMAVQADLSKAYEIEDWEARGWYVYNTLRAVAEESQAPVIEFAEKQGLAYQSRFGSNAVYIEGGVLEHAMTLASLPGVARLRLGKTMYIDPQETQGAEVEDSPNAYGWNLDTLDPASNLYGMQAAQVWADYGVEGYGIVVANIDTGAYYEHEALVSNYRGNQGGGVFDHDYNWYMPTSGCGDGTYPCDNNGHGSGTIGIMAGQTPDLVEQIGVAPETTWIACKGCETNSCSEVALTGCADWLLAPCPIGVDPGDPTCDAGMRPHVINNSWGGGGCDTWYQTYVQAWVAAGQFPAFSAGNTTACSALGSPGDYPESFGTAAHDSAGNNLYAGGPSCFFPNPSCDPYAHEVDPHLNAPTYGRTAGNSQGAYYNLSGTSGASPHTAGVVALLWSGNPGLIGDMDETFMILEQSANPDVPAGTCGEPACAVNHVPNYEYGWGYLDAYAAVTMAGVGGSGWLEGMVTEQGTGTALADVTITAE